MQIEDGKGTGDRAHVTDENKVAVDSVSVSLEHHANVYHEEAYHLIFCTSGIIPGAAFVYIKNTDDKDMIVEGWRLHTECDAKIKVVKDPTVGTITADSNTPANVNLGAGKVADGDFYTSMSGAISGVTGGTTIDRAFFCSGCAEELVNFDCDVIIPKNKELAWVTECCSGCNVAGVIPLYFHEG